MRDVRPAPATVSLRSGPPRSEFALFAGSTLLYQASRFIYSMVAAWLLSPADFSTWAIIAAVLVYVPSLTMGVINGMSRELPLMMGRGSQAEADRTRRAAWIVTLFGVGLVSATSLLFASITSVDRTIPLIIGGLMAATVVYTTQQFELRSRLRFREASFQQGTFGALAVLAATMQLLGVTDSPLGVVAGFYAAALVGAVAIGFIVSPVPRLGRSEIPEIRRLGVIGFPIMLSGLLFSVFVTLDRWVAVTLLGAVEAAPYALASITASAMLVLPSVISQQTYPRMAMERGAGATDASLRKMAKRQGQLAAATTAPVALLVSVAAVLGVPMLVPEYLAAVPAIVILALGFTFLAYLTGYGNFLIVLGAQWQYLAAQLLGVSVALALMVVGGLSLGLPGIALGMTTSHLVYGATLAAVAARIRGAPGRPRTAAADPDGILDR